MDGLTARAILCPVVPQPPSCPLCAYVPTGQTSRELLIDLFTHQQAVHVDPLKGKPLKPWVKLTPTETS